MHSKQRCHRYGQNRYIAIVFQINYASIQPPLYQYELYSHIFLGYLIEFTVPFIIYWFTWSCLLQDVVRRFAAEEHIHSNRKWPAKASWNSNLATKIKKWTGIHISMHQNDIFRLSNWKKFCFDFIFNWKFTDTKKLKYCAVQNQFEVTKRNILMSEMSQMSCLKFFISSVY